jgi:hypothetical protein
LGIVILVSLIALSIILSVNAVIVISLAILGIFIFFYSLARYCVESALISRLCFGELTGQPESNIEARSQVKKKLWSFLFLAFGIWIRIFLVYMGFYALIMAIAFIAISLLSNAGVVAGIFLGLAIFGIFITAVFITVGLVSRWIVSELPLAVETGFNSSKSMERSWQLTKSSVGRIQGIVFVAFLVTIPVQGVGAIPQFALISFDPSSSTYWVVYWISIIFSLGGGALVMPFWQAIKAVIYFDLRNRREGLDLQLRDQE